MKFKGILIGEASGSVASNTFSHNRGGQYIRQRAVPVNPQTVFQQAVRNLISTLTAAWQQTLTAAERAAWDTYALNVPMSDTLGEPRNVGGIGMYCRSNVPRIQAGKARIDTAPAIFNMGSYTPPAIASITASTDLLSLTFTTTDAWADAVGGYMFVYTSRPFSPSVNYFNGPYRFAASINGAVSPPASPVSIALAFPVAVGQRVGVRVRVSQVDGRLSAPFRVVGVAV